MQARRFALRTLLGAGLLILALAGYVWLTAWRPPPEYAGYGAIELAVPVMTAEQYQDVVATHRQPYVYELQSIAGSVLVYGAMHTKEPGDPQIEDLRQQWERFQPTAALVEGRMGFLPADFVNPIRQFGESGAVFGLAKADDVPAYTWEPPIARELGHVLEEFTAEQVALFYVLRPYFSNLRHGKPADPEGYVEEYRRKRTQWPGLEGTLPSMAAIDAAWKRDFPDSPDWREESDQDGLPGYLGAIANRSNAARDEHLVRVILDLTRQGRRVFAVMGSSHAVKLEPALRAARVEGE
ncbi:MAG: hypothetical protein EYC70_00245 [Planctomycetota bacterium]|nr:MAG: hypothetical protein EYC70_00245 [Planctomycetota bacterium]